MSNQEENVEDLERQLSISYQSYVEYAMRTQVEFKTPSQLSVAGGLSKSR